MLDIEFIRKNPEQVRQAAINKGLELDVDLLLKLDSDKRRAIQTINELRAGRRQAAQAFQAKQGANETERAAAQLIKEKLATLESDLREIDEQLGPLLLQVPNIPWDQAPVGTDAAANVVIKTVGKPTKFSFAPKDHLQIGKDLDLIDTERGVVTSGFRGYYLKNEAVLIQYGLIQLAMERLKKAGFSLMTPPILVKEFALNGSGHFPFGKKEVYQLTTAAHDGQNKDGLQYLAGTSEPSLLAYYADSAIPETALPIMLGGISQCYRSEIGSYGKDTKGLYRIHEFLKVEQVVICRPDLIESGKMFDLMQKLAEDFLRDLELPYRLIETSTGDMGAGKYRMVDIETWMPSRNGYGETHSNSNLTDWQARRLGIKVKTKTGTAYAYTLNCTMIASPRILIPLLENNQQADGSVKVPKILQKFVRLKQIPRKT